MRTCSQIEGQNAELNTDLSELGFGLLSDPRLLNTAVTRAHSLLAVVGDPMSLCSIGACRNLWKDYLKRCNANKGLYGCTLKTVMDFCLRSQVLNPSVHEFIPSGSAQIENNETSNGSSSEGTVGTRPCIILLYGPNTLSQQAIYLWQNKTRTCLQKFNIFNKVSKILLVIPGKRTKRF